jgi:hypothetical protein
MDTRVLIAIIVVAAVIVIFAVVLIRRDRERKHLKQQFGSEYDRAVMEQGDTRRAEVVLIEREKRVKKLTLRPLSPSDRERYAEDWAAIQRRFVDDPSSAVAQADTLVNTVMIARGYPITDAEQQAADISVNYPSLVQNYRSATEVMQRHRESRSSTEDLRLAMVNFRALFDELLESTEFQRAAASRNRIAS